MSTDVQEMPPKIDAVTDKQSRRRHKDTEKAHRRSSNFQNKKFKHDHKFRKRSQSFNSSNGKFFPPYKIRKDFRTIIPPTKFLLGGNITDPLNLNSLQDEDINRAMNAVTPKSSPLPTPRHRKGEIEVIIPPDITDPLNLIAGDDDADYEAMLTSPVKRPQKRQKKGKKRKSHRSSSGAGSGKEDAIEGAKLDEAGPLLGEVTKTDNSAEASTETVSEAVASTCKEPQATLLPKRKSDGGNNRGNMRKMELKDRKAEMDKIVSPVIPQPGAWNDRHRFRPPLPRTPRINKDKATPKFKETNARFQYGNYSRYYGYRNPKTTEDPRLKVLEKRKCFFKDKDVLDIGCNTGHVTLAIAKQFCPKKIIGLDIDRSLIDVARKNIKHYVKFGKDKNYFPVSMPIVYGPIEIPSLRSETDFPNNVSFVVGNYVLENDVLLSMEQPQFDVILCLSITKWIQLNFGDAGLKRAFKRMYAQLRPGGVLILEAQSWSSYHRKKQLTPETWKNYHNTELFPHQYTAFLLNEVGFSSVDVIGCSINQSRGFQRPIKMFTKEDPSFDSPGYGALTPLYYRDTPEHIQPFSSSNIRYSYRLSDSVHHWRNIADKTPASVSSPESGFSETIRQTKNGTVVLGPNSSQSRGELDETPNLSGETPSFSGETPSFSGETPTFSGETPTYLVEDCAVTPSQSGESRPSSGIKFEMLEDDSINLSSSGSSSREANPEENTDKTEDYEQEGKGSEMEIGLEESEIGDAHGASKGDSNVNTILSDTCGVKTDEVIACNKLSLSADDNKETPSTAMPIVIAVEEELFGSNECEVKQSELSDGHCCETVSSDTPKNGSDD